MRKGVFAVIAASFLYGIMPMLMKQVIITGLPDGRAVFYRMFFAAIAAFVRVILTGNRFKIEAGQILALAFFGTLGYGMTSALTAASYRYIPTGLATMFQFTYPLFVTVVMTLVFREKLNPLKIISCLRALGGLGLLADFSALSPLGIGLATFSGVTYGLYIIASRKSPFRPLPGIVIVFYACFFSAVFCGARAGITGSLKVLPGPKALVLLLIIAVFCSVASRFLLNMGIRDLGASTASVLNMLEPVVSVVAGALIYKEVMGLKGLIGCALVIISGLAVALSGSGEEEKVKVHVNTKRVG